MRDSPLEPIGTSQYPLSAALSQSDGEHFNTSENSSVSIQYSTESRQLPRRHVVITMNTDEGNEDDEELKLLQQCTSSPSRCSGGLLQEDFGELESLSCMSSNGDNSILESLENAIFLAGDGDDDRLIDNFWCPPTMGEFQDYQERCADDEEQDSFALGSDRFLI
jgi:hypothetical protein